MLQLKAYYDQESSGQDYQKILLSLMGVDIENKTLIDICCGEAPTINGLKMKRKVLVDYVDRGIKLIYPHKDTFVLTDALSDHPIYKEKYDIAIASDAIEHFFREDGYKLKWRMEQISDRQIFFTPLGYLMVNPADEHKSGWEPEDIRGDYAFIICSKWHWSSWKKGGLFFWSTKNIEEDFKRVSDELGIMLRHI